MKSIFGAGNTEIHTALSKIAYAVADWRKAAKRNGLRGDEMMRMERSFEHNNTEQLLRYLPLQRRD